MAGLSVFPDFEAFAAAARHGNLVPVCAERLADLLTPVGAYLRVAASLRRPFLLESAEGGEHIGRYSFLGGDPFLEARGDADGVRVVEPDGEERHLDGDPVTVLAGLQRRWRARPPAGAPPFSGGAVGYVGYDAVRWVERLPRRNPADPDLPWLWLAYYDRLLAFDHLRHRVILVANAHIDDPGDRPGLCRTYERTLQRLEELAALLEAPAAAAAPLDSAAAGDQRLEVESSLGRDDFCRAVRRAKDHIGAGDAFQIVLSRRLRVPTTATPLSVYRALRAINPSPYMFLLDTGSAHVVGSSPEMLVRVQDGRVETRPIAGTRPRGADAHEDARLAEQLLADEKERAEHLMLVDLGRNDVGRVAAYGTVEVPEFMKVERYSHVMHLVSSVRGRLRPDVSPIEALFASFPAGTVSGAPKIRAMEIIEELEPTARGVYAGAILYSDFADNLDSCIAIRTIVMEGGRASVQAGAGIVADSLPEREHDETEQKAAAALQALAWAEAAERLRRAEPAARSPSAKRSRGAGRLAGAEPSVDAKPSQDAEHRRDAEGMRDAKVGR